jgi:hypothetical protein
MVNDDGGDEVMLAYGMTRQLHGLQVGLKSMGR